jgi:5'-nucleotidase
MIIVLTNDDGIESSKLIYAKKILSKYGTVYTVAPKTEQSAKGMSLTIGGFNYDKIDEYNYSIEGTPVDCVNFALGGLKLKPDFLFSGVNNGYNLGFDIKYSGTVGACYQAQYFGFKTIAVSSDYKGSIVLEKELEKTLDYIIENNLLSEDYTLNVNFPQEKDLESKGIMFTVPYYRRYDYKPKMTESRYEPNRKLIWNDELPDDSDGCAIRNGYTSISKLSNK